MDTHFRADQLGSLGAALVQARRGRSSPGHRGGGRASSSPDFFGWLERQLGGREWFQWRDLRLGATWRWFLTSTARSARAMRRRRARSWPPGSPAANARPSVSDTTAVDRGHGAGAPRCPTWPSWSSRASFKREYRDHRLEWMIKSGRPGRGAEGPGAGQHPLHAVVQLRGPDDRFHPAPLRHPRRSPRSRG